MAVDVGGTKLALAVIDAEGRIPARQTQPVDVSSTHAPVRQICRLAALLAGAAGVEQRGSALRRPVAGWSAIGVAVPGLVRRSGTVWAPNLPGWERVPLARLLAKRLRVPVVIESDRNAAVTGEAWRGAGSPTSSR